jgi:hypothetical protein
MIQSTRLTWEIQVGVKVPGNYLPCGRMVIKVRLNTIKVARDELALTPGTDSHNMGISYSYGWLPYKSQCGSDTYLGPQ